MARTAQEIITTLLREDLEEDGAHSLGAQVLWLLLDTNQDDEAQILMKEALLPAYVGDSLSWGNSAQDLLFWAIGQVDLRQALTEAVHG